jgi:hypothetical protein
LLWTLLLVLLALLRTLLLVLLALLLLRTHETEDRHAMRVAYARH